MKSKIIVLFLVSIILMVNGQAQTWLNLIPTTECYGTINQIQGYSILITSSQGCLGNVNEDISVLFTEVSKDVYEMTSYLDLNCSGNIRTQSKVQIGSCVSVPNSQFNAFELSIGVEPYFVPNSIVTIANFGSKNCSTESVNYYSYYVNGFKDYTQSSGLYCINNSPFWYGCVDGDCKYHQYECAACYGVDQSASSQDDNSATTGSDHSVDQRNNPKNYCVWDRCYSTTSGSDSGNSASTGYRVDQSASSQDDNSATTGSEYSLDQRNNPKNYCVWNRCYSTTSGSDSGNSASTGYKSVSQGDIKGMGTGSKTSSASFN